MSTDSDDYLTSILAISELKESNEISVITEPLASSMQLFSLYGTTIDEFYSKLLEYRAIDQKTTADLTARAIFHHIINPDIKTNFNLILYKKTEDDLESQHPSDQQKQSSHAEIDVAIKMNVYPKDPNTKMFIIEEGYCFIELKMFTAPLEQQDKALLPLLQHKPLSEYFKLRHIFGVIGTSYLSYADENNNDPIATELLKQDGGSTPCAWISHLIMMDKRVLNEFSDAPERAKVILKGIKEHQKKISEKLRLNTNLYKYKLIYNILKVMVMTSHLVILQNKVEELQLKLKNIEEETKKRIEEEIKKRVEEERKRIEEEIKKRIEEETKKRIEEERIKLEKEFKEKLENEQRKLKT